MKRIKNVLICGLGAIGTIYARQLEDCTNLKILTDKSRYERYTKNPVIFNGEVCNFDYIMPDKKDFKADLIIIATKNSGLNEAIKSIENFVNDNTVIMSLLNGISSEETIATKYGWDKILFSYFVGHTSTRKGNEITYDGVGEIVFGDKGNDMASPNLLAVKELFEKSKIDFTIPDDIQYSMWKKFLVNVGTNQASAVLGASYKLFLESENALNIAKSLMKEAQAIAKAIGINNTDKMLDEAVEIINSMLPDTKSSMLQDVEMKRRTEVDIFAGKVVELGQKYNIPTPYNSMFYELISAIDEKLTIY